VAVAAGVLGATVFTASASAQMRRGIVSGPAARTRFSSRPIGRIGFGRTPLGRFYPGSLYLPPYYYPAYDYPAYDYEEEPVAPPPPVPPVVVVQSAATPVPAASPAESVVLENRDGQWVRVSNTGPLPGAQSAAGVKEPATPPTPKPTVLVFRDGHNEEFERYMITGNFIFANTNYWSTGSWTRKIPITDLDLPATQKINQERGGTFSLPSGPNQVILRP
jgi:hypothetical protein